MTAGRRGGRSQSGGSKLGGLGGQGRAQEKGGTAYKQMAIRKDSFPTSGLAVQEPWQSEELPCEVRAAGEAAAQSPGRTRFPLE